MMPTPHDRVPPQYPGMPHPGTSWPAGPVPQERVSGPDGNGVTRGETFLFRASAARRWWARIIDGTIVVVLTVAIVVAAAVLGDKGQLSDDVGTIVLVAAYPVVLLVFGALYGCTCSPGQALTGVVSLRSSSGRRVGFWRGMFRYLGVGVFPLTVVTLLMSLLDAPAGYDEPVRVYRR